MNNMDKELQGLEEGAGITQSDPEKRNWIEKRQVIMAYIDSG